MAGGTEAGEAFGIRPVPADGFRVRRIEAGILNAGSDFDSSTTPFAAGLAEPEVARTFAETFLAAPGWRTRVYRTAGLLGLAWRGAAVPVEHIPDPALAERALPASASSTLAPSGTSRSMTAWP